MDKKETVNLVIFLLPSPALIIPFPPVNKLPNNKLLKFLKAYLKILLFVI